MEIKIKDIELNENNLLNILIEKEGTFILLRDCYIKDYKRDLINNDVIQEVEITHDHYTKSE